MIIVVMELEYHFKLVATCAVKNNFFIKLKVRQLSSSLKVSLF